ncbi:MAG: hypothetical protein AAGC60_21785 [Acidobacteriota bacterium]
MRSHARAVASLGPRTILSVGLLTALAVLSWLTARPLSASDLSLDGGQVETDSGSATIGSDLSEKFDLFGFVNLGYGVTDERKYRGVTEDGTADLRTAALQLRYYARERSQFVLQLSHESVGTSPINDLREDVEVDWLFFGHEFKDGTRVRLGRVPLPIGFYNEIKDAGVALPFYRPSGNFYGEGTWTSDSVDGVVLTRSVELGGDWQLSADLYYGEWERIETSGDGPTVGESEIDDALGFYLWLDAPFAGLRVGVGANRFDATGGVFLAPGVTDEEETRYLSLQVGGAPWQLRFEMSRREFTGGYWQPYYLELLYRPTDRLQLAAIYDVGDLLFEIPFFATFDDTIEESIGLGVAYTLRPDLVLKAEHHWVDGFGQIEDIPLNIFFDDPVEVNLFIVSLSASF